MTLYVCPSCIQLISSDNDRDNKFYCIYCQKTSLKSKNNLYKKGDYGKPKMTDEQTETELKDSDVWINRSKSGKGFTIKVGEDFYVGSIESMEKFIKEEVKGINLSISVKKE